MTLERHLAERSRDRFFGKEHDREKKSLAYLGDGAGNVQAGRPNFVYIRFLGDPDNVQEALNHSAVPLLENVVVNVRRTKLAAISYYEVVDEGVGTTYTSSDSTWTDALNSGTQKPLGAHAKQHIRANLGTGGFDPVDIYTRALVPLRGSGQETANMTLHVAGGYYVGDDGLLHYRDAGDSPTFTAPLAGSRWDLLYLEGSSGDFAIYQNCPATGSIPTHPSDLGAGNVPIVFARLSSTTTAITEAILFDARVLYAGAVSSGGSPHTILSTTHTDSAAGAVVAGDLLYGNSTPKWDRLPIGSERKVLGVVGGLPGWMDSPQSLLTAKGDLLVASGANAPVRFGVGTNDYVLTADSTQAAGMKWAPAASSGHTIQDEGTPLTARPNLNFVGAGVVASDDEGNSATVVTIPGGSGVSFQEIDGSPLVSGVTQVLVTNGKLTDNGGGSVTLDLSGGSGTPSDTVETEKTYDQSESAGTADTYARGDHTHGTVGHDALANLTDITLTSPGDGQVLAYDAGSSRWINADVAATPGNAVVPELDYGLTLVTGISTSYARIDHRHGTPTIPNHSQLGGVTANQHHAQAHNLASTDHPDVAILTPDDAQVLTYSEAVGKWINADPPLSGVTAGDTVTDEKTYNQPSAAGVSAMYSRADHTHGTPAPFDHALLSGVTADQHHARLHALDSTADHSNVVITTPLDGQVLVYDADTSKWINGIASDMGIVAADEVQAERSYGLPTGIGVSTTFARGDHTHGTPAVPAHGDLSGVSADQHHTQVHALDSGDHSDVNIGTPAAGDYLGWDAGSSRWINKPATSRGQAYFTFESNLTALSGKLKLYNHYGTTRTIVGVYLAANTAPTGSAVIVDIHKNGVTVFTNQAHRPQIANGVLEGNTTTIDVASWADGEYLTMDIDQIGSVISGADLSVCVVYD